MAKAEDEQKSFQALVKGITHLQYYDDTNLSSELLKEQLYPNLTQEEFDGLWKKVMNILKVMASGDMDFNQLDAFLVSLTKKREGAITHQQAQVFEKFWKSNRSKVHNSLIGRTTWCNLLKSVNWRVDLKSQSVEQANHIPTAVVELKLNNGSTRAVDTVRFEMDENKLNTMLKSLHEIEEQIKKFCNT